MSLPRMHSLLLLVTFTLPVVAQEPPAGQRVFVTGHSFHAWIGKPLAEIAQSAGIKDHKDAGAQGLGGSQVIQIWNLPDEKNAAKKMLVTGIVDVLTVSPHLKIPDEGIDKFTALLLEHNPKGRVYIQASWMPFDSPANIGGKFKNEDRNKADVAAIRKVSDLVFGSLTKQTNALNEKYGGKEKRQVVFIVPVGQAVYTLRERIADGKVPGVTNQADLFTDPIGHPKAPIHVLAAYCYYAAIYQRSPVGLPIPKTLKAANVPAWDEKFNTLLQEIAWEAVQDEPLSGGKKAKK